MFSLKCLAYIVVVAAIIIYPVKWYFNGPMCESEAKIPGKVVIVTGANTGIGKETALDMIQRGGKVYMACRSMSRGEAAANDIIAQTGVSSDRLIVMLLDLGNFDSVRKFAEEFKKRETRLDILINNAGIMFGPYEENKEGIESTFAVNHLGHFLLTNLLMTELVTAAPSRVVTVTSLGHKFGYGMHFDDINLSKQGWRRPYEAYFQSKLANILFTKELGRRLEGKGVTTYAVHPGGIRTELNRHMLNLDSNIVYFFYYTLTWPFAKEPIFGAQTQICCAIDEAMGKQTGKYYGDVTEKPPSQAAQSDEDARRLWTVSLEMVKLSPDETHPLLK